MLNLSGRKPLVLLAITSILCAGVLAVQVARNIRVPIVPRLQPDAPAAIERPASDTISLMQDRLRRNPDDAGAYAQLGWAFLQRVRETNDATQYALSEKAFDESLARDMNEVDALIGKGALAASRHQFAAALNWADRAREQNPFKAQIFGVMGDALTELGRYDEAAVIIQKMVDTRPDVSSYSRVSYQRELHGDIPVAIELMQRAYGSSNQTAESGLWVQVQLGNLYFNSGDYERAAQTYAAALHTKPDYVYAQAGMARVRAAMGDASGAIEIYERIVKTLPMPEFVIALGELQEHEGRTVEAKRAYDLVRVIEKLSASGGVDVDLELALFDADHGGDPLETVIRAREVVARRPSVAAFDALAWSLFRAGNYAEARNYSVKALALGTRDSMLHFHAGMIAIALGDVVSGKTELEQALKINPHFNVLRADEARKALVNLH